MTVRLTAVIGLMLAAAACSDEGPTGLAREGCGPPPHFNVSPVPLADLDFVAVIGWLGAPVHTLPTPHSALLLKREGVPVMAPGRIQINSVRRVTYLQSPTRQGERDYSVFFSVCEDVEGWFGHLTSLAPAVPDNAAGSGCQTYSTVDETVESCTEGVGDLVLEAGQALGTAGLSAERGFLSLDFGLLDHRVDNFYLTPSRYPEATLHAVCPYDYFDSTNRASLLDAVRDPARPEEVPTGEPRCGTMEVDVGGTAKGVWAEQGVTGRVQGDESRYLTLADNPYNPQQSLALSLGPTALGALVAVVPRAADGSVNRQFEQVTADGQMYCYTPVSASFGFGSSWLVSMPAASTLVIERIEHSGTPGPCADDPLSWQTSGAAMTFAR